MPSIEKSSYLLKNHSILIAILTVVSFIIGSSLIFTLYPKSASQLQLEEDVQFLIELRKSIDFSKLSEIHRTKREVSTVQSCNEHFGKSIKLVGKANEVLTETKGSGYRLINKWNLEQGFDVAESSFQLVDGSYVKVLKNGIYLIYSQLSIMMKPKTTVEYEIGKIDSSQITLKKAITKKFWTSLAYCNAIKTDKVSKAKQCHTAVTVKLKPGDLIGIFIQKENFTVDFFPEKSFFGMTLLMTL